MVGRVSGRVSEECARRGEQWGRPWRHDREHFVPHNAQPGPHGEGKRAGSSQAPRVDTAVCIAVQCILSENGRLAFASVPVESKEIATIAKRVPFCASHGAPRCAGLARPRSTIPRGVRARSCSRCSPRLEHCVQPAL